jgi:chemosensory pili system protein ChpA (sensor histidine kinase/response regulator)
VSHPPDILVVDDEPALREITAEILAAEGYQVRTAANGREALDRVREDRPAVIVLDLMMPVLDGWAFIESYREMAGGDIPIVGVSAVLTPAAAERLRQLGVRVCLAKPFDLGELLECVARLVGRPAIGPGRDQPPPLVLDAVLQD